jgi:hypothetical protein
MTRYCPVDAQTIARRRLTIMQPLMPRRGRAGLMGGGALRNFLPTRD